MAGGDLDDRLVTALCRAAEHEPGDAEDAVRAHVRRLAPLAGPRTPSASSGRRSPGSTASAPSTRCLADPTVDEVLVNAGGDIWVERHGDLTRRGEIPPADLAIVIERILAPLGRRLDRTTPIVDARLADGTRVCAVVPPISLGGTCLSLRRFRTTPLPLDAFASHRWRRSSPTSSSGACNVVVSRRHVVGQDVAAVEPADARHRPASGSSCSRTPPSWHRPPITSCDWRPGRRRADGVAAITLERLLHTALRLRPDRLVVGEVRGPEVLGLVQALNTGHDGSLSTCHANSAGTQCTGWRRS